MLRQQLVQVAIAGDTTRDLRIARPDQVAVALAERIHGTIDLGAPAAGSEDLVQRLVARLADGEARAVVG